MKRPRVIPILQLRGKGLVKTLKFGSASYVGDPLNAVRIFNEKEVDELTVIDIVASKDRRGPDFALIARLTEECFMPLCYGGGITTLEQISSLFKLGVEKVALNTAAIMTPDLLRKAADTFGSQSVVASIDYKRSVFGRPTVFSHSGAKVKTEDPIEFAGAMVAAGAGELIVSSVDRDGTREGFDIEYLKRIANAVSVPVVATGGGGSLDHYRDVLNQSGVSAAAGGSYFVHQGKHRAVLITYPKPAEIESLRR